MRKGTDRRLVVQVIDWAYQRALRSILAHLGELDRRDDQLEERLNEVEDRMTTQDQGWAEVAAATDRQGEGLRAIAETLAGLTTSDTEIGGRLGQLATRINQHADAAFAMATDGPTNPVPVPVPDPVGGAPLPGAEPVPGAETTPGGPVAGGPVAEADTPGAPSTPPPAPGSPFTSGV